jgi:glycosyltransferase involved in cell wall biosynthesis
MTEYEVLVVGPESRDTGGVAQYVREQRRRLPERVSVDVYDTAAPSGSGPLWLLRFVAATLLTALRFPLRERPDLVHVHTSHGVAFYRAAWYVLVASALWRRPVVLHVHGSSFDEFVAGNPPLARRVFDRCSAVVVLSPYWREALADHVDPERLVVVPNAVEANRYAPSYDTDPPRVAFVSNLIERKGVTEFATAVERLQATHEFTVDIAGDGPLAPVATDLAAAYPAVEYHGYVSERRKRELLDRATVYALPTHAEGLPIALLEGMAGGAAVVTTGVGAIPGVVGPENGRLVEPGDTEALAEALGSLVADPETAVAMGRANRALVEERYDWPAVVERLATVYDRVLAGEPLPESGVAVRDRPEAGAVADQ